MSGTVVLASRIETALASQRHDAAALVTHAGAMKVISGHTQNLPPSTWM